MHNPVQDGIGQPGLREEGVPLISRELARYQQGSCAHAPITSMLRQAAASA